MGTLGRLGAHRRDRRSSPLPAWWRRSPPSRRRRDAAAAADAPLVEALPIRTDALLPAPTSYFREERFQRGDTLPGLPRSAWASPSAHVERAHARCAPCSSCGPARTSPPRSSADGEPLALSFLSGRDTLVADRGRRRGLTASTEERAQLETRTVMKSGVIRSSLFAASDAAGIPDSVAMQLADVFGGDIDFHRDLRKGDRFAVVYELHHLAGRPVRAGRVLAAEFTNQRKTFRAVHFGNGYYAPDGKNLRKAFLRSPLEFSRVSSGFGMRRHPIAQALARAQGHRLRGADRHARARGRRRRRRVRRPEGRLRQRRDPAPPRPVHHASTRT